jgi:multiple sugar transport system substrate-binding protein
MPTENPKVINRREFLRAAAIVGGAAVVSVVAAACGANPTAAPTSAPAATAAPAATTAAAAPTAAPAVISGANITYLGGPWSFLPDLDVVIDAFVADWSKQNNVKVTAVREGTNLLAKIQTAIETGSGANIIQYSTPVSTFAKSLADVSDVYQFINDQGGGFIPSASNAVTNGGKRLGVPLGQNSWMMNYREDWFKEAGYDKFPDTYDDLLAAGTKLKAAGRPFGLTFSDKAGGDGNATPRMILWAFGGKEFNPDGSVALDSKETIAALEYAIKLHNAAGDPGETAYDDGANNAAFLAGKISMTPNVNTIYIPALKNTPDIAKAMNTAIPPKGPGGRFTGTQINWWGILNNTKGKDLDASKDLIKQFFSIKNLDAFFKAGRGYIIPMLPKYENEAIWDPDPKLATAKQVFTLSLPPGYNLTEQTKLSSLMIDKVIMGKLFSQACSTGNARAALDGILKDINDLKLLS